MKPFEITRYAGATVINGELCYNPELESALFNKTCFEHSTPCHVVPMWIPNLEA